MPDPRDPIADLKRIAFLLEAAQEPGYRIRAFRSAATTLAGLSADEVAERAATGGLRELSGIGEVTERTILESLRGEEPVYLRRLESTEGRPLADGAAELRAALRGDCHAHTLASDGGASIREMAESAIELGHEYLAITDHSPRLTVANGLTTDRLLAQLDEIAALNAELSPFRLLTGIEVDINEDGSLDQEPDVLAGLDVVVGSVHSALRSDARAMTVRMVTALADPNLDILGHCTGPHEDGTAQPSGIGVRCRHRVRRRGALRQGRRDQLAPGAARPAQAPAAPGGGGGLPGRHRLGRPHARSALLAGKRLRASLPVRRHAGDDRERSSRR